MNILFALTATGEMLGACKTSDAWWKIRGKSDGTGAMNPRSGRASSEALPPEW